MTALDPSLLFRGGYVVTEGSALPDPLGHASFPADDLLDRIDAWELVRFGPFVIRFDETWPCARSDRDGASVLVLGTAVHVDEPELTDAGVADRLAACVARSWEAFYDALDLLGGAHLVFVRAGGRTLVLQDATGVEALCYDVSGGPRLLASHPALIAELRGYELSPLAHWWLEHPRIGDGGYYFPGVRTAFEEVRLLTPNTALDLETLGVERFFPRAPLEPRPLEEIVEATAPRLTSQFQRLTADGPVSLSLSGGLDTRLTLAAAREAAADLHFFTYQVWGNGVQARDVETASALAERFGLRHEVFRVRRGADDPDVAALWRRMHRGTQGAPSLAGGLLAQYPAGHLHVRSNVLETVRGFYMKNSLNHAERFDDYKLARLFRTSTAKEFEPYFREFSAVTGFGPEILQGMHYSDLFYWEHRMGAWHGGMVRGLKLVHRTYTLYNCRAVLTTMMGRPLADRADARVVWALMDDLWPEILETPIFSGSSYLDRPRRRRRRIFG